MKKHVKTIEHSINTKQYDAYVACMWKNRSKEEVIGTVMGTIKDDWEPLPLRCYYALTGELVTVYEDTLEAANMMYDVQ